MLSSSRLGQHSRLFTVYREGFLADDVFAVTESEHTILKVMRVRCGYVENIETWVLHQLFVRPVCCALDAFGLTRLNHVTNELRS